MPQPYRRTFGIAGRYTVIVECADNLTDEDMRMIEACSRTALGQLPRHDHDGRDEQATDAELQPFDIGHHPQRASSHA